MTEDQDLERVPVEEVTNEHLMMVLAHALNAGAQKPYYIVADHVCSRYEITDSTYKHDKTDKVIGCYADTITAYGIFETYSWRDYYEGTHLVIHVDENGNRKKYMI